MRWIHIIGRQSGAHRKWFGWPGYVGFDALVPFMLTHLGII